MPRGSRSSRERTKIRVTTRSVGEFLIEGLAEVPAGNQIMVKLDLDLNGILKVTATERATGLAKHIVIDSAMERFRQSQRSDAVDRLDAVFGTVEEPHTGFAAIGHAQPGGDGGSVPSLSTPIGELPPTLRQAIESAKALAAKAERVLPDANAEDAEELRAMLADLQRGRRPSGRG